jgi:hypothetical protein
VRESLRFEAVFAPVSDARVRLDGAAEARGWSVAAGEEPRYSRPRTNAEAALAPELRLSEGWCTFAVDLRRSAVDAHGWTAIEDLLIGWCKAVDAILARSVGPDGFPRLEPWELTGAVDAVDAVQWLGPGLAARLGVAKTRLTIPDHRAVGAAFWLRVVSDPFEDPSEPAEDLADSLRLGLRQRPPAVVAAIEQARIDRAARASLRTDDAEACAAAVRTRLPPDAGAAFESFLAAAGAAGVRDRVARHVRACLEHYGVDAIVAGLPVLAVAAPALLRSEPEDVVEAVVRALAWRPPSGRRVIEMVVSLERWVANVEDGPGILRMILEADDPGFIDGLIALDLMDVRRCPCEACVDRRRRLAEATTPGG